MLDIIKDFDGYMEGSIKFYFTFQEMLELKVMSVLLSFHFGIFLLNEVNTLHSHMSE